MSNIELLTNDSLPWTIALLEINRVFSAALERSLGGNQKWICKVGPTSQHSVAIGILQEIPFDVLQISKDPPVLGVRLGGSIPISVVNVSLPCGVVCGIKQKVSSIISEVPYPLLLVEDMNVHHPTCGVRNAGPRCVTLLVTFEEADLVPLNDGIPTFFNGHSAIAIDVTTAS